MKFTAALALVLSKRRRLEHGSWDSYAKDRIAELDAIKTVSTRTVIVHEPQKPQRDLRDEFADFIAGPKS